MSARPQGFFLFIPQVRPDLNHFAHFLSMHSKMNAAWLGAFSRVATFAGLGLSESNWFSFSRTQQRNSKRIAYFLSSVMETRLSIKRG